MIKVYWIIIRWLIAMTGLIFLTITEHYQFVLICLIIIITLFLISEDLKKYQIQLQKKLDKYKG